MREYVIREGSMYAGTHNVYENADECRTVLINPGINIHKWAVDDYRKYLDIFMPGSIMQYFPTCLAIIDTDQY